LKLSRILSRNSGRRWNKALISFKDSYWFFQLDLSFILGRREINIYYGVGGAIKSYFLTYMTLPLLELRRAFRGLR
jgi:hypothetical protein